MTSDILERAAEAVEGADLINTVSGFVAAVWHLMDNSETSGPVDDQTITVWKPNFDEVSEFLDRFEGLPSGSSEYLSAANLVHAHLSSALSSAIAEGDRLEQACLNQGIAISRLNAAITERDAEIERLTARAEAAEAEALEQARLNGMGAERELALMAKADRWERMADRLAVELTRTAEFARLVELQASKGSGGRRGGSVFAKATAALSAHAAMKEVR